MDRIRKILVATDYSEDARRAETRAAMLSVELKAETLELMTVRDAKTGVRAVATASNTGEVRPGEAIIPLENIKDSPLQLRDATERASVRTLCTGRGPEAILERAGQIRADLIVVAAKGKRFFADLFRRYSNDELIRQADRPVLLVNSEPREPYKKVLVAIDFSAESMEAARVALAIAPTAQFTFLHAYRVSNENMMLETGVAVDVINGYRMRARETARTKMNHLIDGLGPRRQLISRAIHHGMPFSTIDAQARQLNADLIALGKHGKSLFAELLLGSVTQRLVDRGARDLLVAASPASKDPDYRPAA